MGCKVKELRFGLHKCRTPGENLTIHAKILQKLWQTSIIKDTRNKRGIVWTKQAKSCGRFTSFI